MEMKKIYRAAKCPSLCFNREQAGCTNSETSNGQMVLCNCEATVRKAKRYGYVFDEEFYRAHSIDLSAAGMGVAHFIESGCKEFRCYRFTHATQPPLVVNCAAHLLRKKTPATLNHDIQKAGAGAPEKTAHAHLIHKLPEFASRGDIRVFFT